LQEQRAKGVKEEGQEEVAHDRNESCSGAGLLGTQ
jgi:hypothetical protein